MSEPVLDNSPAPGDFTLGNVASPPAVSSITVSGDAVTLGLSAGLISGESYELSYARTSGSIRDAASNLLANFTGRSVDTSADIVPPVPSNLRRAVSAEYDNVITFNEPVQADADRRIATGRLEAPTRAPSPYPGTRIPEMPQES